MTYGSSEYYVYAVLSAIKNPLQVKVFHPTLLHGWGDHYHWSVFKLVLRRSVHRLIDWSAHLLAGCAPYIVKSKMNDMRFIVVNIVRAVFSLNPAALIR